MGKEKNPTQSRDIFAAFFCSCDRRLLRLRTGPTNSLLMVKCLGLAGACMKAGIPSD